MQKIKAIIFDFDGTMYLGDVWKNWGEHLKAGFLKVLKNPQKVEQVFLKHNLNLRSSTKDAIFACEQEKISAKKFYKFFGKNVYQHTLKDVEVLPDDFLKALSEKYSLYVVSLSNKEYLKHYFKLYNINKKYFKKIMPTNLLNESKSKAVAYKQIQKKEKISANEILVVGDNFDNDILPAQEMGCQTLHFKHSFNLLYDFLTENKILDYEKYKKQG